MKVGVVSLPLHTNYGGILQTYALLFYLQKLGHNAVFVNRGKTLGAVKRLLSKLGLRRKSLRHYKRKPGAKNIQTFIDKHIVATPDINSSVGMKKLLGNGFDAFVVGSDQVWRPRYAGDRIENFFLDFTDGSKVRRLSYAASFGMDQWVASDTGLTAKLKLLLEKFDAISVREDSAVDICKEVFDVRAEHHVDPTMLLTAADYVKLFEAEGEEELSTGLYVYMLDRSEAKEQMFCRIAKETGLELFFAGESPGEAKGSKCSLPTVTSWLRGFYDAKLVVTDSFHGTVFSILFNKPFWVVLNKERGVARYESLLKMFGLTNRIIEPDTMVQFADPIDFSVVNDLVDQQRKRSELYFRKHL